MHNEHLGYRETSTRFQIRHKQILDWERIYLVESPEGLAVERRGRGSKGRPKEISKEAEEDLLAEVQRLRTENEYLKNCRPWFWNGSDAKGENPCSPKTKAKTSA